MTYVTLILGIIGGLISLITTGSVSAVNTLKKRNAELDTENADLKAKLAAAEGKTKVIVDDAVARREQIIAGLKAEIATMEADLSANHDPAALRDRLNKLLAVP